MKKSYNLILSLFSLFFIAALVSVSYLKYDIGNGFLKGVIEFLTIPVILLTVILLIINAIKWSNEKWSMKNNTFFVLLILVLTIGTMIFASIYNI